MKAIPNVLILTLAFMLTMILISQCQKDEPNPIVTISDDNFLSALIELGIDTDGDSQISNSEAATIRSLDVSECEISDLNGIEKFVNLDTLWCYDNQLTSLDVSNLLDLRYLGCGNNQLISLDVTDNAAL